MSLGIDEEGTLSSPIGGDRGRHRYSPGRAPRRSRAISVLLGIAFVGALVGGATLIVAGSRTHPAKPAPLPKRPFSVAPQSLPSTAASPAMINQRLTGGRVGSCSTTLARRRIVIPALCMDGPVVPTSLARDGSLIIPEDVHRVGIWDGGAPIVGPGGHAVTSGTTLLAGHVNYVGQGNGTFYDLYRSRPGDLVYLTDAAGHVTRWRIFSLRTVVKSALPRSLFAGNSGPRRLVLVTCGGPILREAGYATYRDNVIAEAAPA
jgi:hypothetical protein